MVVAHIVASLLYSEMLCKMQGAFTSQVCVDFAVDPEPPLMCVWKPWACRTQGCWYALFSNFARVYVPFLEYMTLQHLLCAYRLHI